jgi:predicted DNA-binding transcriptional regulator AlpA
MEHEQDKILTASEAAERLKLSTRTLDRIATEDRGLTKIQLSPRRIGYRQSDVTRFIARGGVVA